MRSRTQLPQREPPYARRTVFCAFAVVAYSRGRRAGTCCGFQSVDGYTDGQGKSYTGQFGTAVTAFGCCAALLQVQEAQGAAGGLDDADLVGAGVVAVLNFMLAFCSFSKIFFCFGRSGIANGACFSMVGSMGNVRVASSVLQALGGHCDGIVDVCRDRGG